MKSIGFKDITLTGGFWKSKYDLNKNVTINAVYDVFNKSGRIDAFNVNWKEGDNEELKPHYFWDSDVAKWMEGASYLIEKEPNADLEKKIRDLIDLIEKNRDETGYFNIYHQLFTKDNYFKEFTHHELYCAGHLMEAAVAFKNATGDDKFIRLMSDYTDYIIKRFITDHDTAFDFSGHPEIELALIKMYNETEDKKYLELCRYLIDQRGVGKGEKDPYFQSHKPVREQDEPVGHSVRACYLYSGMADLAVIDNDRALRDICFKLYDNIVSKKMFITGGIGSNSSLEAFSQNYYLPNINAYAETCAAISLAYFAKRMRTMDINTRYGDLIERIIYNGFLSGLSLDGKKFFYENPLELHPEIIKENNMHYPIPERVEIFSCSCCPPNVNRFLASIGDYIAFEDRGIFYIDQFADCEIETDINGKHIKVRLETNYPDTGKIKITALEGAPVSAAIRVPYWSSNYKDAKCSDGYLLGTLEENDPVFVDFGMPVHFYSGNSNIIDTQGKVALMRGPVVYCAEEADNGKGISSVAVDIDEALDSIVLEYNEDYHMNTITVDAYKDVPSEDLYFDARALSQNKISFKYIPYYAFANRGENEMAVWIRRK